VYVSRRHYLAGNVDEQRENPNDKQVVDDADRSDDDVDNLECDVADVGDIGGMKVVLRRQGGRRDVVPDITQPRRVLHHRRPLSCLSNAATTRTLEIVCGAGGGSHTSMPNAFPYTIARVAEHYCSTNDDLPLLAAALAADATCQ